MSCIRKKWAIALVLSALPVGGCSGQSQLVGSDASSAAGPSNGAGDVSYALMGPLNFGPGKCLPEPIDADACKLLATRPTAECSCSEPGMTPSASGATEAMRKQLELVGFCGNAGQSPCTDYCACEVSRAIGTSLLECRTLPNASPDSSGWCYVAGDAGEPQAELVAECPTTQQQKLRFIGDPALLSGLPSFLACVDDAREALPRALGEVCSEEFESAISNFRGYGVNEVNIDDRSTVCDSGFCVINHFQGLVSCPYGQAAGAGDCLRPGSNESLPFKVDPQLVERQAATAAICSCHCAGPGPGPYCTCPDSMQCEPLVEDLGLGSPNLAGSYCIPKGTAYDPNAPHTECVAPNCGVAHPY